MASLQTGFRNTKDQESDLRSISTMNTNQQHSAAAVGPPSHPSGARQRDGKLVPGCCLENTLIVRDALRMNLPRHLVIGHVERRIQTCGTNYSHMRDLVSDLFKPNGQEVPMETNQLEEELMMRSSVVKKALRMGVPTHLIKPKVRAKILSNKDGYADVCELLKDLDIT